MELIFYINVTAKIATSNNNQKKKKDPALFYDGSAFCCYVSINWEISSSVAG